MPLPTVLMTDVVRSSQQGDSHGGAYLINLEDGSFEQVLDWNTTDIDWQGRGMGRGLRGICFVDNEIYIAASNELFVFDLQFQILRSHTNPYLHHCHEICYDGQRYIYLSATSFDSVLRFDTHKGVYDIAWWVHPVTKRAGAKQVRVLGIKPYDPNGKMGPEQADTLHINNVSMHDGAVHFSGLKMGVFLRMAGNDLQPIAGVGATTHNCQVSESGILLNSTGNDAAVLQDTKGTVLKSFAYPRYDDSDLTNTNIPGDFARQAFGRGLCVFEEDGLVIAGSSPGTVTAFDLTTCERVRSVQVTNDLRNAPHGLEVWPF
ncbi:MAG: hypothetical protein JKY96_02395 [Phycisphaerales bacterium]|nr:hypothetical protein [Phycisphaerales bacterium]